MFGKVPQFVFMMLLLLPLAGYAEEENPSLDSLVQGIESFYADKDSLQIQFSQTVRKKYQPSSLDGKSRTGTAFFQKPGKMRWDYSAPNPVYYISDGNTLWVFEPEENVAYKGAVEGSQLYGAMKFLFGAGKLSEEFEVSLGKDEGELVLRSREGSTAFKRISLFVESGSFEIRRTVVEDPLGDLSEIVFDKIRYAPISNPEWFDWKPADGVTVKELTEKGR